MKRYRRTALCMALALGLTACGSKTAEVPSSSATATAADEIKMGRWVESQLDLGGREIAGGPTLLDDGSLVLYAYEEDPNTQEVGALTKMASTDNGETWSEEDTGWNDQVEGFVIHVWNGSDGTACLSSVVLGEDGRASNGYQFYLQKPGGALEPLTIDELDSVYEAVFYDETLCLFHQSYSESGGHSLLTNYNLETGESQNITLDEAVSSSGGIQPTVAGDKLLFLYYAESSMPLMELHPQDGSCTQVLDSLSEAISPSALVGDSDGALYYPAQDGIYRLAPGGTLPEQVVPGEGTALSVISNYPTAICRAANGDFLVTQFGDNSDHKIYRYHYDETLPTHAETTLTVWSLQDSATARAAINLYKQEHPDVDVTFTVAVSEDVQDKTAARNDALTQLNTQLLAGEGPDLLILDGVSYETYADKGLLADLSDALPLADLEKNLTDPFVEDGKVYAMPARFSVPILLGDEGTLDGLTDLAAVQQAVLEAPARPTTDDYNPLSEEERYAMRFTCAEDFAEFLLPVTANAILQGNSLNEDALRQVMTFVESVSSYYDVKDSVSDNTWSSAQSWTGTDVITVDSQQAEYSQMGRARYGWFSLDTPYSLLTMARSESPQDPSAEDVPCNVILRPGLTSGAYTPKVLVSVNAGSGHLDQAKELAATFFATGVQGSYYSDGMTVRTDCLDQKVQDVLNDEHASADAVKTDIRELLSSCTTPVLVPALLQDSFLEHTQAIIQGQETAEEAVQGIRGDISLYLAEQS